MKIRPLPLELQQKANKELNEDPKKIQDGLKSLREWLKFQKHLHFRDEDHLLVGFLRGCKFSIEITKKKLDYYYTSRTLSPEFFKDRSPFNKQIQTILENNIVSPYTPNLTFPKIFYVNWFQIEKNNVTIEDIVQHHFMAIDLLMNEEDDIFINGMIIIVDMKDVSLTHLMQIHIPTVKKYFLILQNSFPIRIKGVVIINALSFVDTLYKLCEVVFSEKIRKRINIYSKENSHKLVKLVPKHLLVNELGGNVGTTEEIAGAWRKKIESYSNWFKEDSQYKSNEELRVGEPKTQSNVFGIEGSFRQLNFD